MRYHAESGGSKKDFYPRGISRFGKVFPVPYMRILWRLNNTALRGWLYPGFSPPRTQSHIISTLRKTKISYSPVKYKRIWLCDLGSRVIFLNESMHMPVHNALIFPDCTGDRRRWTACGYSHAVNSSAAVQACWELRGNATSDESLNYLPNRTFKNYRRTWLRQDYTWIRKSSRRGINRNNLCQRELL